MLQKNDAATHHFPSHRWHLHCGATIHTPSTGWTISTPSGVAQFGDGGLPSRGTEKQLLQRPQNRLGLGSRVLVQGKGTAGEPGKFAIVIFLIIESARHYVT